LIEISPELVLVDPELAQVARLRSAEEAAARDSVVLRQSEPPPPSSATSLLVPIAGRPVAPRLDRATAAARATAERMTPTLLFVSLLLNLVFAASLFAGNSDAPTLEPAPAPPAAKPLGQTESKSSKLPTGRQKTSPRTVVQGGVVSARTKADAERTVLALALQGGRGRAPKLIDPRTGQLRNNVQSVCRGAGDGSLLCVVSPPHHKPGEGLYFRYHPRRGTGGAAIIWLGYRLSG
jgi:hypothetical protein